MARLLALRRCPKAMVFMAFLSVYVFWGSTYIGIHFAIQTIPPFLMSGVRFMLAGLVMFVPVAIKERKLPGARDWLIAAVLGFMLIFAGNAGSTWAVKYIPSSLSALLVATEPLFIVLLAWILKLEKRPSLKVVLGLLLGIAGIASLFGVSTNLTGSAIERVAMTVVLVAAFFWALGSVISVRLQSNLSPMYASALMLMMGGVLFTILGTLTGEASTMRLSQVSSTSVGAVAYLIVFGSVIPLTAYVWLLRKCHAHRVATYAFVNPVVAMGLGWALAGEALTLQSAIATILIVASTAVLVMRKSEPVIEPEEELVSTPEPILAVS